MERQIEYLSEVGELNRCGSQIVESSSQKSSRLLETLLG